MFSKLKSTAVLFSAGLIATLASCSKSNPGGEVDPPAPESAKYGFVVSSGTPAANYNLVANSLTEGVLTTASNGAKSNYAAITSKGKFYYGIDTDSKTLVKYTSDNSKISLIKEIPFPPISWAYYSSFYKWKDDKTLVLFSSDAAIQFEYAILDVENMKITNSGKLNIPGLMDGYYFWAYNAAFIGDKLYLAYTQENNDTGVSVGTTYLASMDYPSMNNITVTQDNRFTFPSHYTLNVQSSFTLDQTAYFITSPTIWSTKTKDKPFGIFRVQNNSKEIDPTYFYELTDRTKEEAVGLTYVGNNKAVVRILDKTKITSSDSYGTEYITSFYLVDVKAQTKTKINIPLAKGTPFTENVVADGDNIFIAANTVEGYYVYQYNTSSQVVSKGLKLEGINAVSKMVKL